MNQALTRGEHGRLLGARWHENPGNEEKNVDVCFLELLCIGGSSLVL